MQNGTKGMFTLYVPVWLKGYYIPIQISWYSFSQSILENGPISGSYIERGKRKEQGFEIPVNNSMAILQGWDHPEVPNQFRDEGNFRAWKFGGFDVDPTTNFNAFIAEYLGDKPEILIFDGRRYPEKPVIKEEDEVIQDVAPVQEFEYSNVPIPEDIYEEGSMQRVITNRYERNDAARKKCIEHYGTTCVVCGFDFSAVYGSIAQGFIHVHHIIPISTIKDTYQIDPVNDLRPICPNCHAVAHMKSPPYTIDELRRLIQQHKP